MAKLVFGMNQSLDDYVDHQEFGPPSPALFRHFIDQVRQLAIPDGLPTRQLLRDERRTFLSVVTIQAADVVWIGAPKDTGCARIHIRIRIRTSREVPGCAVSGFQPNLTDSVQLRRIRIQRALTLPVIEDA